MANDWRRIFDNFWNPSPNPVEGEAAKIVGNAWWNPSPALDEKPAPVRGEIIRAPEPTKAVPPIPDLARSTPAPPPPEPTRTAAAGLKIPEPRPAGAAPFASSSPASPSPLDFIGKHFAPENAGLMWSIMRAESDGNPIATRVNKNGSVDRGLFQINDIHIPALRSAGIITKPDDLFDPETNVKAARYVWDQAGGPSPWKASQARWGAEGAGKTWLQKLADVVGPKPAGAEPYTGPTTELILGNQRTLYGFDKNERPFVLDDYAKENFLHAKARMLAHIEDLLGRGMENVRTGRTVTRDKKTGAVTQESDTFQPVDYRAAAANLFQGMSKWTEEELKPGIEAEKTRVVEQYNKGLLEHYGRQDTEEERSNKEKEKEARQKLQIDLEKIGIDKEKAKKTAANAKALAVFEKFGKKKTTDKLGNAIEVDDLAALKRGMAIFEALESGDSGALLEALRERRRDMVNGVLMERVFDPETNLWSAPQPVQMTPAERFSAQKNATAPSASIPDLTKRRKYNSTIGWFE